MYFVINKTMNPVVIGDLNFELKPRQAIDMDMVFARHQIEASKNLKAAINTGIVAVRQETRKKRKEDASSSSRGSDDIDKMKKEIRDEIKTQMGDIADAIRGSRPEPAAPAQPLEHSVKVEQPDQQELLGALAKLTEVMKSVGINTQSGPAAGQQSVIDSVSEDIDPAIAKKIHAKAVDKMAGGLESKVKYEEKKSEGRSIGDRADELDKLMGD
jgi:hypothetical protein